MLNIKTIVDKIKNSQYRSETDFARKVGISYQGWLAIKKRGKTTNRRALKISETLGVEVKDILEESYYTLYKEDLTEEINTGFSARLRELLEYLGIGVNEFGRETGIPASSVSTIMSRDTAHIRFIYKIAHRYRWLNIRWLITGEGEIRDEFMIKAAESIEEYKNISEIETQLQQQKEEIKRIEQSLKKLKK